MNIACDQGASSHDVSMRVTSMTVGVPRETKTAENRVALTPEAVRELTASGVKVVVEQGAGLGASITDNEYEAAGAEIAGTTEQVWSQNLVVKVKEPQKHEFRYLRDDLTLFTYLHLAAYPVVAKALLEARTTSIAYETVQKNGTLPLLAPMSEIAGRLAPQMAAHCLERHNNGRGVLLSGAPGVKPGQVLVIGAGVVGFNAARIALGMGADVTVADLSVERLRWVDDITGGRIRTLSSNKGAIERAAAEADVVIGAVLVPGGRAPVVVSESTIQTMQAGSVIVDVAVDQGGCIETTHETTHLDPTYMKHGVVHYAVGNMPGAVPRTATYALSNSTLPYVSRLASSGVVAAITADESLAGGLTTVAGLYANKEVAACFGSGFLEKQRIAEILSEVKPGTRW